MNTKQEVGKFLEDIKVKISTGVLKLSFLDDRGKNAQALLDLDITPNMRLEVIMKLKAEDFYRTEEGKFFGKFEMHSFGKMVKNNEVYIKISKTDNGIICISFHKSEFPIKYSFK
jgi:hypothetical protein